MMRKGDTQERGVVTSITKEKLNLNGCYHYFLKCRENKRFTVQYTNTISDINFYSICDTTYVNRKG